MIFSRPLSGVDSRVESDEICKTSANESIGGFRNLNCLQKERKEAIDNGPVCAHPCPDQNEPEHRLAAVNPIRSPPARESVGPVDFADNLADRWHGGDVLTRSIGNV